MKQMSQFGKLINRDKLDELFSSYKIARQAHKVKRDSLVDLFTSIVQNFFMTLGAWSQKIPIHIRTLSMIVGNKMCYHTLYNLVFMFILCWPSSFAC